MKSMNIESENIVFICGLHRSGTSLLHELLKKHPDISGFSDTGVPKDEGQHLQSVYPPAKVFGGPGRFGLDPDSFMDESHPLVSKGNAKRLLEEWSHYWDLSKSHFVEKSPPNLVRMRFLQALFPNAKFIVIFRHPVAVTYATKAKFYKKGTVEGLMNHWTVCHYRFLQDLPFMNTFHLLRYEELAENYQRELEKIFNYLNVSYASINAEVSGIENIKYFDKWSIDKKSVLANDNSNLAQWVESAKKFGYRMDEHLTELEPMGFIHYLRAEGVDIWQS
jgi:hypothetical protein